MANTLASVYGALNILKIEGIGSLDTIPSNILKEGDVGIVVNTSEFHVFKLLESRDIKDTIPPFNINNPPLCIKPIDDKNTDKRWILIYSSEYTIKDFIIPAGKKLYVEKIETKDGFTITDGQTNKPILQYKNGKLNLIDVITPELETKNIKTEKINGTPENMYVLRNGSRSFLNTIEGVYPKKDTDLATKRYIDDEITKLQPDNIMRRDGTTAFSAPVLGIMPIEKLHLTPKFYVDSKIEEAVEGALQKVADMANELEKNFDPRNIIEYIKTNETVTAKDRTLVIIENLSKNITCFLDGRKQGDMIYIKNFNTTNYIIEVKSVNIGEMVERKNLINLDTKIKSCTCYYDGRDWYLIDVTT